MLNADSLKTNSEAHGWFIKYDDAKGILVDDKDLGIVGVYWYENPRHDSYGIGYVPTKRTHNMQDEEQMKNFNLQSWLEDIHALDQPLKTKEEVEIWLMCNPGHELYVRDIYKHLY